MSYNLKDFLSFKLNINQFEELAFASSNFSMPKNTLKHVLLAEELHNQGSDSKDTVNEAIPGAHIEVEEKKESLLSKITKKISDFFKPKPKVYRLGNNESLEIDGEVPGNSVGGFFNKIGAAIEKFANKGKEIKDAAKIKNAPQVISEYPAKISEKGKSDPSLLDEGKFTPNPNLNLGTIGQAQKAKTQGSYIQSTPSPAITVEEVTVDGESELSVNKKAIAKAADSLTSADKTVETAEQGTIKPAEPIQEHDDDYSK